MNKFSNALIFCVNLVFFLSPPAVAQLNDDFVCIKKLGASSRGALLAEMDRRFENVRGFTATFRQESRMLAGTGSVANQGKVSFLKPGRMYWQYENPLQLFISNAETVWYYQPDGDSLEAGGGEITLIDFERAFSSETPGSFLLGLGALSKDFKMVSGCETKKGYSVKLRPIVEDENLEEFFLLVRKWDNVAIGAKIVDFSENETIIRFYNIKTNTGLKRSFFDYKIPRGVYVDDRRQKRSPRAARRASQSDKLDAKRRYQEKKYDSKSFDNDKPVIRERGLGEAAAGGYTNFNEVDILNE